VIDAKAVSRFVAFLSGGVARWNRFPATLAALARPGAAPLQVAVAGRRGADAPQIVNKIGTERFRHADPSGKLCPWSPAASEQRLRRLVHPRPNPDGASLRSISFALGRVPGGDAIPTGLASAGRQQPGSPAVPEPLSPPILTGTKLTTLTPTAAAILWRHIVSSPGTAPFGRATSEMFAPSSKLSATLRAFSSAVHRRRRRPVITSIRR
jgi:hypothetical protein